MLVPEVRTGRGGVVARDHDLGRVAFAQSVIRGLADQPRWLSCRYLYDERGSAIFERITEQPEYYLTRTEAGILAQHAGAIRALAGPTTLVELGAGTATKTRHLLRAWMAADRAAHYVAIDISRDVLATSCAELRAEFPGLAVRGVPGSYEQAFPLLRELSPLTLLFLGSSVGNLNPSELDEFLALLARHLGAGDQLLLGIDLVKDARTLEAAYNDAAGWSAAFTLNLFVRMNHELGTGLDLSAIEHVAYWNSTLARIEIYARFTREQVLALPEWGRRFRIAGGEMVLTEISRKFEVDHLLGVAARHGFDGVQTFTDPTRAFGLLLLRRGRRGHSRRHELRRELDAQRARTLELLAPLDDLQLADQHSPLMSPLVWDLGHVACFESQWVSRASGGTDDGDVLYDPLVHPRAVRGTLPLPGRRACLEALAAVRADALSLLARTTFPSAEPLLARGYLFRMIAQHEAQHSETMLQAVQLIPELIYEPARREPPPLALLGFDASQAWMPAGPFVMGTDDVTVAYDNERPAHLVELAAYRIDLAPVTNCQYLRFVEDGGYRRRELWSDAGWLWLLKVRAVHPGQWLSGPDGRWWERAFGRLEPLVLDRPVVHVSWYEAAAYARWAGKRLPTEAEWEKAAGWDPERGVPRRYPWGDTAPTPRHANLDQRVFAPAAVGAYPEGQSWIGCHQLLGDVWEWTASDFAPYPGFEPFPYREYSAAHFGRGYKVLRGGSWATPTIAIRNTFRNWDFPERRQLFAGFRCASD